VEKSQRTGPEHFRAGEECLRHMATLDPQGSHVQARMHTAVAEKAQVHFLAALTASFGMMAADADLGAPSEGWGALLGVDTGPSPERAEPLDGEADPA